jgi:hypothetical protein
MAKLKLKDGPDCNKAFAMIAKDGEQVLWVGQGMAHLARQRLASIS